MNAPAYDIFKMFGDFKSPAQIFDFNQFFTIQRRNLEAVTAANQIVAEGIQAVTRRQAELTRTNVEQVMKAGREAISSGSPEASAAKQAEVAKTMFEKSFNNVREVFEMLTKSNLEAFDLLNKRMAEAMEETGDAAATASPKKSSKK